MEYIAFSECGNRWENQDSYRIKQQDDGLLLICCDGMAHHHGFESSETVCNAIVGFWEQNQDFVDCEDKIRKACKKASEIFHRSLLYTTTPMVQYHFPTQQINNPHLYYFGMFHSLTYKQYHLFLTKKQLLDP